MRNSVVLGLAMLSMLATPAMAEGMKTSASASKTMVMERPVSWVVATFNNEPEDLMFLGVAKVPANEGVLDRVIRMAAGAGLVYGAATQPSWGTTGQVAGYTVGGLLLFTGVDGYCPAYHLMGINTRF